jgi:hypothetical protein
MSSGDEQYGGWCTNWAAFDVPTLWKMLEHEGRDENYEQSGAWDRTYELLAYHMNQLQRCRDDLAAKWPPQRSPAAGVFLDYIDNLIGSMKQMSDDSLANGSALSGINSALVSVREQIRKLNDQWQHYQSREEHPDKLLGLIPLGADVPDNWRQKLKYEAARHMVDADTQVFQHTSKMVVPTPYQPPSGEISETWTPDPNAGTNAQSGASANGASGSNARWAQAPVIPPPPVTQLPSPQATGVTSAPILTGGLATTGPAAPTPTQPTAPLTSVPSGSVPSSGPVVAPPTFVPGGSAAIVGGKGLGQRSAGAIGPAAVDERLLRGRAGILPPGGVIGGQPITERPSVVACTSILITLG